MHSVMKLKFLNIICLSLLVSILNNANAQTKSSVVVEILPDNKIGVFWLTPNVITPSGAVIYRSENGGAYTKITSNPITIGTFKIDATKYASNKTITKTILNQEKLKTSRLDNVLGADILIEAIINPEFAEYLGIQYQDNQITAGNKYKYKVMEIKSGTESLLADSKEITAGNYKPAEPPKNITFKAKKSKSIGFKWEPEVERYFGFNVYCSTTGNVADEKKINKKPILINKIKDENNNEVWPEYFFSCDTLKKDLSYTFRFSVVDFLGIEGEKSQVFNSKAPDFDPPKAVENIKIKEDGLKIKLTWTLNKPSDDMAGMYISRSYTTDQNYVRITNQLLPNNTLTFEDNVDKPGYYYYMVITVDKNNNENKSAHSLIEATDKVPPAVPKNIKVKAETGKLTISWDANTEPDLKGYLIFRSNSAVEGKSKDEHYELINVNPTKETTYIETKAEYIKNEFYYEILAIDTNYNKSGLTLPIHAHMPDVTPPHKPFIKEDEVMSDGSVKISWLANLEDDLKGYTIYRSQKGDSANFKKMNNDLLSPKTLFYVDKSIQPDVDYYYYLTATDSTGNTSEKSHVEHIEFPKQFDKLPPITDLSVKYDKNSSGILLAWTAKKNEAIIGYTVFRKVPDEQKFVPITGMINTGTFVDMKLDKKYNEAEYEVHEFSKHGTVERSNKVLYQLDKK